METEPGTCIYCDHEVADQTIVPAVDDDEGWTDLSAEHYTGCEWFTTRAHRLFLEELFDELNAVAPPYAVFGASEGDGADYGFWPELDRLIEDARYDSDVIKVSDTSDVPDGFTGMVVHVNDHFNVTLYQATNGHLVEGWAVV